MSDGSNLPVPQYECGVCGRRFHSKDGLEYHKRHTCTGVDG